MRHGIVVSPQFYGLFISLVKSLVVELDELLD